MAKNALQVFVPYIAYDTFALAERHDIFAIRQILPIIIYYYKNPTSA